VIKKHSRGEVGRKEAKLLTTLRHEHINVIYGSGGDNRSTVIISEYAQGGSLADRMVRKYDWQAAMKIVAQAASALDFAHRNNIVHGNLRPSNVLFDAGDNVKLTDFGLPSHHDTAAKKNWYGPPEFKASKQGDIYALGVILHQLLLGRLPEYEPITDKLKLEELYMQVPEAIADILKKMLAIRVANRYKSCAEMLLDWDEHQRREQDYSRRHTPVVTPPTPVKKTPVWVYAAIGGGFVAVILITLWISGVFSK
jgi:serine/threonine-protein kinase